MIRFFYGDDMSAGLIVLKITELVIMFDYVFDNNDMSANTWSSKGDKVISVLNYIFIKWQIFNININFD